MDDGPWFPKRSVFEMRRVTAETLNGLETDCRRQGWGAYPALVYDGEKNLLSLRDGRFAFSREHAGWGLLRKRGRLKWIENAGGAG